MTVRDVEGKLPYTGGKAISIDENKVISLNLRDENNLIIYDEGDDEIYVDLQLPDGIRPLDAFPVGVTTGRVLVADDWDVTGTIVCFKTTSGDNIKLLYADDGKLYIDNGTGTFKQIYLKGEVDALLQALKDYTDAQLALKQDKLTAGNGISIDNNNEISNTLPGPIVSSSAPLDPAEGDLWYDTTNDILKVYDGTNWNIVGDDTTNINTKAFYLSSNSDLTNAQAAYSWWLDGKTAILYVGSIGPMFIISGQSSQTTSLLWEGACENIGEVTAGSVSTIKKPSAYFEIQNGNVVTVSSSSVGAISGGFLSTDIDYSTPYTPAYNGSPATKKYVDDKSTIVSSSAPSSPTEGMLWYDTTNDVLKSYDGSSWNSVGGGGGDVTGPSSSTANDIAVFDGTTGKLIKDSGKLLSDYLAKTNTSSYTPSSNYNPATKKYVDDNTSNKASNTDLYNVHRTDYSGLQSFIAGNGIFLRDKSVNHKISQGPCPDGYYIPSDNDWGDLKNKLYQMGIDSPTMNWVNYLLMPLMGRLDRETGEPVGVSDDSSMGGYQTSSVYLPITNTNSWCQVLGFRNANPTTDYPYVGWAYRGDAYPIRPFKIETVMPDSSWTQLYDASTLGTGAGIYHNATLGLISLGATSTAYPRYWMTIADKNLGASVAYHYGDTKSEANCGQYFQWGNNYGNPFTGASSTTTNLQETYDKNGSNSFYYNKFVITTGDWSKLRNDKLWGALNTYAIENQFQVFELNDILDLDNATKLYNHLRNGRTGFLKFSLYKTIYIPYYVSNTEVKFYAINGFGPVNSGTRCQFRGYKFTINNSVVTSISVNNNSIAISSSTPTQPGNDTITLVI